MSKKSKIPRSVVLEEFKEYINAGGEQIATIFEKLEQPSHLPHHQGIWTLLPKLEYDSSAGFVFIPETMKNGFVSFPQNTKTLNLVDNNRKLIIPLTSSVYHFLAEDVADIVKVINSETYGDLELIVDISGSADFIFNRSDYDMYWLLLRSFKDKKIKHKIVNFLDYDAVYIDNFFLISNGYAEYSRFTDIYNYFSDYIEDKNIVPTRKVYLSRTKVPVPEFVEYLDPDTKNPIKVNPERIDDEAGLEKLFKGLGFEIIHPEDFTTFEEQLNFFYSVKTVASLTSSGLSNAIFMQPGGTLIEIVTPLTARPISNGTPGYLNREFHNYYKNIAISKGHLYIGLPNSYAKLNELEDFLELNANAKRILKQVK